MFTLSNEPIVEMNSDPISIATTPTTDEQPGEVLGRIGSLETRLANCQLEIEQSQRLRYDVFYGEMSASTSGTCKSLKLDRDQFDAYCDHLLVIDNDGQDTARHGRIVGCYRALGPEAVSQMGRFYSDSEFKLSQLAKKHSDKNFLEMGRSCVMAPYRNKRTIELLWHGTWAYVLRNNIDVMVGCASFETTNVGELAQPLSFLYHHARANSDWDVEAVEGRGERMDLIGEGELDQRAALRQMPALIKGYLRLGAKVASRAVVDAQFGTTDVMIIMPVSDLNPRYVSYYGQNAERHSA